MTFSVKDICWIVFLNLSLFSIQAQESWSIQNFKNLLPSAKARTWWHWLNEDEHLPKDFESKGNGIKKWQDWLLNSTKLPSEHLTFNAYKHWDKDAKMQSSGLPGPIKSYLLRCFKLIKGISLWTYIEHS